MSLNSGAYLGKGACTMALLSKMLVALMALAVPVGIAAQLRRHRFNARLDDLEGSLVGVGPPSLLRSDLPPQVVELALRLGAKAQEPAPYVVLRQSGWMWRTPGAMPMRFVARQTIATATPGFMWRALFDPFGSVVVADYFVAGHGGLEARVLGVVRVAREVGNADVDRGEAIRYLAELPWNPDAILHNPSLEWTVVSPRTIKVATGRGAGRAEVTFELDDSGLIRAGSAADRPYIDGARRLLRPWHGRFWDYREIDGRRVPMQGEVAWVLDGRDFIYWRGRIEAWETGRSSN